MPQSPVERYLAFQRRQPLPSESIKCDEADPHPGAPSFPSDGSWPGLIGSLGTAKDVATTASELWPSAERYEQEDLPRTPWADITASALSPTCTLPQGQGWVVDGLSVHESPSEVTSCLEQQIGPFSSALSRPPFVPEVASNPDPSTDTSLGPSFPFGHDGHEETGTRQAPLADDADPSATQASQSSSRRQTKAGSSSGPKRGPKGPAGKGTRTPADWEADKTLLLGTSSSTDWHIYHGPHDSQNSAEGPPRVYYISTPRRLLWEASEDGKTATMRCWKDQTHSPIEVKRPDSKQKTAIRSFSCHLDCYDRRFRTSLADPGAFQGAYTYCPETVHQPTLDEPNRRPPLVSVASGWKNRCYPCSQDVLLSKLRDEYRREQQGEEYSGGE